MKFFSSNLEYLRNQRNLNQSDITDHLGIERSRWSNYERGKSVPNLELFHRIAAYFEVSENELLNTDLRSTAKKTKTNREDEIRKSEKRYIDQTDDYEHKLEEPESSKYTSLNYHLQAIARLYNDEIQKLKQQIEELKRKVKKTS